MEPFFLTGYEINFELIYSKYLNLYLLIHFNIFIFNWKDKFSNIILWHYTNIALLSLNHIFRITVSYQKVLIDCVWRGNHFLSSLMTKSWFQENQWYLVLSFLNSINIPMIIDLVNLELYYFVKIKKCHSNICTLSPMNQIQWGVILVKNVFYFRILALL